MIPFAVLMAVAVPIIVLWTRMSLPKYVGRWNRKKGPPESGHTVTLVLTDVEGSTELWEAFQEVRHHVLSLKSPYQKAVLATSCVICRLCPSVVCMKSFSTQHAMVQ